MSNRLRALAWVSALLVALGGCKNAGSVVTPANRTGVLPLTASDFEKLIRDLEPPFDANVRETAAATLQHNLNPAAIRPLLDGLPNARYRSSQQEILTALGKFDDGRKLPVLIEFVRRSDDLRDSDVVTGQIAAMGPGVIPKLFQAFPCTPGDADRDGAEGDPWLVQMLRKMYPRNPDVVLEAARAADVCHRVVAISALPWVVFDECFERGHEGSREFNAIVESLDCPNPDVLLAALEAVKTCREGVGGAQGSWELPFDYSSAVTSIKRAQTNSDKRVRRRATEVLHGLQTQQ
jgi:hypothetical protein